MSPEDTSPRPKPRCQGNARSNLSRFERLTDLSEGLARVAEEHARFLVIEKRVVDAGEAMAHAALEDDDVASAVDVEDRHSVNRARRVVAGGGVYDIVRANHQNDIGLRDSPLTCSISNS